MVDNFVGPVDVKGSCTFALGLLATQAATKLRQLPAQDTVLLQTQLSQGSVELARLQARVVAPHLAGSNALIGFNGAQQGVLHQCRWPDDIAAIALAVTIAAALVLALWRQ